MINVPRLEYAVNHADIENFTILTNYVGTVNNRNSNHFVFGGKSMCFTFAANSFNYIHE